MTAPSNPIGAARWVLTGLVAAAMFAASGMSIYGGAVDRGAPIVVAVLIPVAYDLAAAAAALGALDNARHGEHPGVLRLALWGLVAGSASMNYAHASAAWGGPLLGAAFAAIPVFAAVLVDAGIRALLREELKAAGLIPEPIPVHASMPVAAFGWRRYVLSPVETTRALRASVKEGVADPTLAVAVARGVMTPPALLAPEVDTTGGHQVDTRVSTSNGHQVSPPVSTNGRVDTVHQVHTTQVDTGGQVDTTQVSKSDRIRQALDTVPTSTRWASDVVDHLAAAGVEVTVSQVSRIIRNEVGS